MQPSPKALYYPYIEFQDLDWLKAALLYWEGVKRILPYEGYPADDPPEIRELISADIVENVFANTYHKKASAAYKARLEARSRRRKRAAAKIRMPRRAARRRREVRAEYENVVHKAKLAPSLQMYLLAHGCAIKEGDWFRMKASRAGDYMTLLANVISRKLSAPAVTDGPGNFFRRIQSQYGVGPKTLELATIISPFPRPESLHSIPLRKVIKFRESNGAERRKFREHIEDIAQGLSKLEGPEALRDFVEDEKAATRDTLKEQREQLRALNIKSLWSGMTLSVPSWFAPFAIHGSPMVVATVGAVALAVGGISVALGAKAERKKIERACPLQYLVALEGKWPGLVPEQGVSVKALQEAYKARRWLRKPK